MATIFLKPIRIDESTELGSLDVQLCGYGSRSPVARGQGSENGVFMDAATLNVQATGAGNTYNFPLIGNDEIEPPGTYYTITIRNNNGDILQCNAYQFLDDDYYDLSNTDPFDPNQGPPPLPPAILDLLEVVAYSANPVFNGFEYPSWIITLTGDAAGTFQDFIDGNLYTIIICQDATGGHAFTYSANVFNATPANPDPNGITIQTFVATDNFLLAIGAGTWVTGGPLLAALKRWKP